MLNAFCEPHSRTVWFPCRETRGLHFREAREVSGMVFHGIWPDIDCADD